MRKRALPTLLGLVIAFVSLGLSPAYAVDERVIDIVEVTWPGAEAPVGNVAKLANVVDVEVNSDWKKFTTLYGDTKDRVVSFKTGKVLTTPIGLVSKMACFGFASSEFLNSIRPEAYKRLGITDYSERYLLVISPKAGCGGSVDGECGESVVSLAVSPLSGETGEGCDVETVCAVSGEFEGGV